jgi:hypothetical protein
VGNILIQHINTQNKFIQMVRPLRLYRREGVHLKLQGQTEINNITNSNAMHHELCLRKPLLDTILHLISSSMFLNMEIIFSYKFIATTMNSRVTFRSASLFQRLVLSNLSNSFINFRKKQRRLVLLLENSSSVTINI